MKEEYNWWTDPKNKEEVERISWWDKSENRHFVDFPIALVGDGKYWCASIHPAEKFLGPNINGCAQGSTKETAIRRLFEIVRLSIDYNEDCRRNYQRFVPFRKGPWGHIGGRWFAIFGIHFSFRYGNNMRGGWYIPFTKLNISISSDWAAYKRWKNNNLKTK